jgi:putative endonuclease
MKAKIIGKQGEAQAEAYLRAQGYTTVAKNFRAGRGEIDLIVQKDDLLVFVEVKKRKNDDFGSPESFLSQRQIDKILETAEAFIEQQAWQAAIRFDIVAITTQKGDLTHLEDAF